ncbi:MAG: hypothetical protein ABJC62_13275 [Frankiaceae bacterium]|jgi:hypothetical protein
MDIELRHRLAALHAEGAEHIAALLAATIWAMDAGQIVEIGTRTGTPRSVTSGKGALLAVKQP